MKARDREVRRHEQAHAAAGGAYSATPSYSTERAPDDQLYAVAGTIPIDASPVGGDPAATIRKMGFVKRAALPPADPSGQDRAVASQAAAARTRAKLAQQAAAERTESLRIGGESRAVGPVATSPSLVPQRAHQAIAAYQRAARCCGDTWGRSLGWICGGRRAHSTPVRVELRGLAANGCGDDAGGNCCERR
jgi:hypothetical protein